MPVMSGGPLVALIAACRGAAVAGPVAPGCPVGGASAGGVSSAAAFPGACAEAAAGGSSCANGSVDVQNGQAAIKASAQLRSMSEPFLIPAPTETVKPATHIAEKAASRRKGERGWEAPAGAAPAADEHHNRPRGRLKRVGSAELPSSPCRGDCVG